MATIATAGLAVLGALLLAAAPAMAASSPSELPAISGDSGSCTELGADSIGDSGWLCIRLGVYTSSSGVRSLTAQVEGWCEETVGQTSTIEQCSNINADATIANATYTDWTTKACGHANGACDTPWSWLYPFGGLGFTGCDNNVWAVIAGGDNKTYITLPRSGINVYLDSNLEDGHYNVCPS
jgi:hypothetical protein